MDPKITIREPVVEDAEALGRVHVRAWQAAYADGLMPAEYLAGLDPRDRARWWRTELHDVPPPRFGRFVAEDEDGTLVGFILVGPRAGHPTSASGEVFALNVDPRAWGRGHGRALLRAGHRALAAAGFRRAVLWVHPGNRRARRFYEANGWECVGEQRLQEVFGVETPEIRYRRRLDSAEPPWDASMSAPEHPVARRRHDRG